MVIAVAVLVSLDWAPEMLIRVKGRRQPYDFTVDWWSFGCVLYEFISGKCPFRTDFARTLDRNKVSNTEAGHTTQAVALH